MAEEGINGFVVTLPMAEYDRLREIEAALRAWMVTPGRGDTAASVGRAHRRLVAALAAKAIAQSAAS